MKDKTKKSKWTFADVVREHGPSLAMPDLDKLYERALNTRENRRETYQRGLNAALENLMSWERMARADGFDVICATDIHQGSPYPVFDDDNRTITFVQAYGVMVKEREAHND